MGRGCRVARRRHQHRAGDSDDTFWVKIDITAAFRNSTELLAAIDNFDSPLEDIRQAIEYGEFDAEVGAGLKAGNLYLMNISVGCPEGSIFKNGFCYRCAAGTYDNSLGSCVDCELGTYQDLHGQTACELCPADYHTAAPGAAFRDQCVPNQPLAIILSVGVCGLLGTVAVVVIVVRKKWKTKNSDAKNKGCCDEGTESDYGEIDSKTKS